MQSPTQLGSYTRLVNSAPSVSNAQQNNCIPALRFLIIAFAEVLHKRVYRSNALYDCNTSAVKACNSQIINPLPTNDAHMRHGLSIS